MSSFESLMKPGRGKSLVLFLCTQVEKHGKYGKNGKGGKRLQVPTDKGPERYPLFFTDFAQTPFLAPHASALPGCATPRLAGKL